MRRLNVTVIAGIIAAVLGVLIVVTYGRGVDQRVAAGKQTVGVLVTTAPLTAGATPSAISTKVEMKQVPREYLSGDSLSALSALPTGAVLRAPIAKGTQLNRSAFTDPATGSGGAGGLSPAKDSVAIAVRVGMVPGVAHYVTPGSTIDLFVTYKAVKPEPNATVTTPILTKLFASAVHVLAVTPSGPTSAAALADDVLLVLEVRPALAQTIINAQAGGELYAALTTGERHTTSGGSSPADVLNGAR